VALITLSSLLIFIIWKIKKKEVKNEPHVHESIENPIILKAKKFIEEHLNDEKLSRDEIANCVGLTPSYLSVLYKKETGQHISEYINYARLEKAKELLATTSKNISEIAYEVGFSSQSYFTRLFSHEFKISPNKYRKKTWEKYPI
jgi:two-component system response regulator YesN